jgi:hypothetical protein
LDRTKARPPKLRNGLEENTSLLLPAYAPGARRVIAEPFCVPDIDVTRNSLPDTKVAAKVPRLEMTVPLVAVSVNLKLKVTEFANRFWAPVSKKKSTGNVAKSLDDVRI